MLSFDPDSFMNTTTTDANSTESVPVPIGEYPGAIEKVEAKTAGDKPVLDVHWNVSDQDGSIQAATGREKNVVRQTVWLDITEAGGLDFGKGKNVSLGKLREAVGQNQPGKPWAPGMLVGQVALLSIGHRSGKSPGEIFADVKAVAAM